jgi:crotonobetainyl-CoA:carnitine CoA-transferase CaiB-like acyl-CoA transferase
MRTHAQPVVHVTLALRFNDEKGLPVLEGIKVLSFTHYLQGPSATQMLADLGAEVIKIEPFGGAFERSWSGPDAFVSGESIFFMIANRNARSVAIDLKAAGSRQVLLDLVDSADVVIESFRPGTMRRLGLGYEELHERNPRLVYASLSGYGSTGPYKDRPGQDVLLQAMSGLAASTGRGDGPPTPVGASIVDQHAAALGAFGIVAALMGRVNSGKGTLVESSLLNAALDLQIEPLGYFLNGFDSLRSNEGVSSRYYKAPYGVFEASDGFVCLSINSHANLAAAFDDPWFLSVSDEDAYARRDEVNARIKTHIEVLPVAKLAGVFAANKMWWAPVNEYADVVADPQVIHNDCFETFDIAAVGPITVLGHPLRYGGKKPAVRWAPRRLGADTRDVLAELGYDAAAINDLIAQKAVRADLQVASHDL